MFNVNPGTLKVAVPFTIVVDKRPPSILAVTSPVAFSKPVTMIVAFSPAIIGSALPLMFKSFLGVGLSLTFTVTVLFSAGAYCPLPGNETVIIALPPATAVTTPLLSTVTILVSLEVNVRLPASDGFNVASIVAFSPTVKSKEVVLTVMLVGIIGFTFKLTPIISLSTVAFT